MRSALTPKQVARAIGVSEASLKRWCDKGLLPSTRTVGGHRRIPLPSVIRFLRDSHRALIRPEILGLPASIGTGDTVIGRVQPVAQAALEAGDIEQLRRIVLDLYLAGHSIAVICDRILAESFRAIGERWEHGELEVYQERRACEVCVRILHEWHSLLPVPSVGAPAAFGGTFSDDPYQLPTAMVALVLRELGWAAESYGSGLPPEALASAIRRNRPRLFWLSASTLSSPDSFTTNLATVFETASSENVGVVVGGRALTPAIRERVQYSAYCDNLQHLVAFAQTVYTRPMEIVRSHDASSLIDADGESGETILDGVAGD